MVISGLGTAVWSVVKVAGVGFAAAELAARGGEAPVRFIGRSRWSPGERAALGFLLGWAAFGTALLGLAATGLFFGPLIIGVLVVMVAGIGAGQGLKSRIAAMLKSAGGEGWWSRVIVAAALVPAAAALALYDHTWDSAVYHLGFPWQLLLAHRMMLDAVPMPFWTPLPVDIAWAVPLVLGDERVGKALVLIHLLALAAIWQERCRRQRNPEAGWLGVVLVLASGLTLSMLTDCTNDLPASCQCVAGMLLTMGGAWGAGAALLGCGIAAKFVYGPLIAVWLAGYRPRPPRLRPGAAALLILPVMAWVARSWLAMGHPGFPFVFPGMTAWDWSPLNQAASQDFQASVAAPGSGEFWRLPWIWISTMAKDRTLFLVLVPLLLFAASSRRAMLVAVAGGLAVLWAGKIVRYTLPADMLLALLTASSVTMHRSLRAIRVPAMAGLLAVLVIWTSPVMRERPWSEAGLPGPQVDALTGSTFEEARGAMERLRVRRVLTVGDWRTYRIPARVRYGGISGETPVGWRLAHDASTPAEVRKRIRQSGAEAVLFNFVSAEWLEVRYGAFAWDARMVRLYVDFCKAYLEPCWQSAGCDYANGGFILYTVRRDPRPSLPAAIWFVPGMESLYADATFRLTTRDVERAIASFKGVLDRIPDVGQAWNQVGHAYMTVGDTRAALPYLRKFGDAGMRDGNNLPELYAAAIKEGDRSLAARILPELMRRYPTHPLTLAFTRGSGAPSR